MNLRYITCSDPREHNRISDIVDLAKMPHAEIAVQCHPSKMSDGMPRNVWFQKLLKQFRDIQKLHLAIHINKEWADVICCAGKFPDVLLEWIKLRDCANRPVIQRIQINMPDFAVQNIQPDKVAQIINDFHRREFIFQYNDRTKDAIEKIHRTGAKFSLLFDASGGNGIQPQTWQKPIYATHKTGYSGGISPDNVIHNLRQINTIVSPDADIWIDAEKRLTSNNLFDEKNKFDVDLAKLYVKRANDWSKQR